MVKGKRQSKTLNKSTVLWTLLINKQIWLTNLYQPVWFSSSKSPFQDCFRLWPYVLEIFFQNLKGKNKFQQFLLNQIVSNSQLRQYVSMFFSSDVRVGVSTDFVSTFIIDLILCFHPF